MTQRKHSLCWELQTPTDAKAVTSLTKFLPKLSEVCEPLRRLLDKDIEWHWLAKQDDAVHEIMRLVPNTPVLRYYDVTKPVTVKSDARMNGLGCCLLQGGQPVAFASRALTQTDKTMLKSRKECLSIVFCHPDRVRTAGPSPAPEFHFLQIRQIAHTQERMMYSKS